MKKLYLFLILLAYKGNSQITLFQDSFPNTSQWNITSGQLFTSGGIASTEGDSNMTLAFGNFYTSFGSNEIIKVSFNSNNVTNFATSGWAGLSLYTGGSGGNERIFIGTPGLVSSWGLAGSCFPSNVVCSSTNPNTTVDFEYSYNTGEWRLKVGSEFLSGITTPNLDFNTVRIGADVDNLADIALSNLLITKNNSFTLNTENQELNNTQISFTNPVIDNLKINYNANQIPENINIYNFLGQKVMLETSNLNEINCSNLSSGHYILELQTKETKFIKKFIKQ